MEQRVFLICVIFHITSAIDNNSITIPGGSICATIENINELFDNIANAVEQRNCTSACDLSGKCYATRADIEELWRNISVIMKTTKQRPKDCEDVMNQGNLTTGIYIVYPFQKITGIDVRCDMHTTSGGWTVIQRRLSYSDFYKNWQEYELGFGNLSSNFWLGNANIHMLTRQNRYTLRVDLTSNDGNTAYAEYSEFAIGNTESGYKLFVKGYSGTAGDSLTSRANGRKFSTYDRDNDVYSGHCAVMYHGAWWYDSCHTSNLNGDYGNTQFAKGPVWSPWKGYYAPMKITEMKIRRIM